MRLTDFGRIAYGKEDSDTPETQRKDIIYRAFLGDRQVWEKTIEDDDNTNASYNVITDWKIVNDFSLAKVTDVTSITGFVNWGDNDEDDWRSGNANYFHHYVTEGNYKITIKCKNYLPAAKIAQIAETAHYTYGDPRNELIGVTMSLMPFADFRLGTNNKGVFEDIITITRVTIPIGITRVPPRLFYNTSFTELSFPEQEDDLVIGDYAFVSNEVEKIIISKNVTTIGTHALGFGTNGSVVSGLNVYCHANSAGYDYAVNVLELPEEQIHILAE